MGVLFVPQFPKLGSRWLFALQRPVETVHRFKLRAASSFNREGLSRVTVSASANFPSPRNTSLRDKEVTAPPWLPKLLCLALDKVQKPY